MLLPGAMTVIAHRGSSGTAPENTLIAFRRAVESGADWLELDVRRTADDGLVVFHDRTLARTTNGRGPLFRRTVDEIRSLDAGRWFSSRYAGEHVPMLAMVLEKVPLRIGINIEIKTDGDRHWRSRTVLRLVELLREQGRGRPILVTSFNHRFLKQLHSIAPSIAIGVLALPLRDTGRAPSFFVRTIGARAFVCSRASLRKRHVHDAHRHGMKVFVYGVNTARHLLRPRRFGVDGVITNYPARMLRLLGRAAHRSSLDMT